MLPGDFIRKLRLKCMKTSLWIIFCVLLAGCVSQKKFEQAQADSEAKVAKQMKQNAELQEELKKTKANLSAKENDLLVCKTDLTNERNRVSSVEKQIDYFKNTNDNLLERLADLSVVSKSGAESIKKSLEAIGQQNSYIQNLTSSIQRKDSLNLVLVMNLKRSLASFDDEDITIEVKKGVVYVSLSDKLLFKSGSYEVSGKADEVLGKIAKVVNDHKELDILIEGHTDNVPIATAVLVDNWDLSVKRATSIVRILQEKYNVKPERMTAGGRSYYVPKAANDSAQGKAMNRRTEIIILPKLDQFFKLLESPTVASIQTK